MVLESAPSSGNEFHDLERHDLLTGEPRYVEDEIRNTRFALIFGILGFLFALISMILTWVLYHRDSNRTFLWHGIWTTIAVVFFLIVIVWALGASKAVKQGRQPGNFLTFFVFIGSLVLIGYLLAESVWLILYRKVHFDRLAAYSSDQNEFNNHVANGYNFDEAWRQHRKMIWWIVFFNLAAAIVLAFIAYAARSVTWHRYNLARITLYLALTLMVLWAWLMIYWVEESYEYRKALPSGFSGNLLTVIKAAAIVALVFAVINAFVNMLQSKAGYFVMAALEIALIIAMIMTIGIILRNVRYGLFKDVIREGDCSATLYSIHENELSDRWCPVGGKYLAAGQTCRKQDLVVRYEGQTGGTGAQPLGVQQNQEIRSLNPGCCESSKFYYIYPFMLLGFYTLLCIFTTAVAVGSNLYLADTNEYLSSMNRSVGLIDFLGLAAVLIMLIAWGIYFIARKANSIQFAPSTAAASFNDPFNNRIAGFDLVPESIKVFANDTGASVSDGCFAFNSSGAAIPTFSTSTSTSNCTNANDCVIRLALLLRDSTARVTNAGGAVQGSTTNRQLFFPDCTGVQNDYIFYYGTESQLRDLLNSLRICPRSTGSNSVSYLQYVDQVSRSQIQNNGQLPSENTGPVVVNNVDGASCGTGFSGAASCRGRCSISRSITQTQTLQPLKGRLFFIDNGKTRFDVPNTISVNAFFRNDRIGTTRSLYANGIFTILDIPRQDSNSFIATVDIVESTGAFLRKKVDILVQPNSTGNFEISAGFIRLDTPDGKVCTFNDTTCISNQRRLNGKINVVVRDGSGQFASDQSPSLGGVDLNLIRWHQVSGQNFGTAQTGVDGRAVFDNIRYDSYTVLANKTGFRPVVGFLDLQQPEFTVAPVILRPNVDEFDMRVVAQINEPNVDFDLNLLIRSDNSKECLVSPINKYCAYASHINDVDLADNGGEENILVKKLAVATYMAYLAPSPAYAGTCSQSQNVDRNRQRYHTQTGWNWEQFKKTKDLSELDINTFTFGRNTEFPQFVDFRDNLVGLLRVDEQVESPSEAKEKKQLINKNGNPVGGSIFENTFFGNGSDGFNRSNDTVTPPNQSIVINGTVTANFSTNFTTNSGDCKGTLTNITYNNNTNLGFVLSSRILNLTVCNNGTNFTNDNFTTRYFGFDQGRYNIENSSYSIAYANGTSIMTRTNTNFSFPNDNFDIVRNSSNSSQVLNATITTGGAFSAFNVTNTNFTYNDTTILIYNPPSANIANTTVRKITEIEYIISELLTNYSQLFNFIYTSNSTGDIGTRNVTSYEVELFGKVILTEICNVSRLANDSTTLACALTNFTTFNNGTVFNTTSTRTETDTDDINAGVNIALSFIKLSATLPNGAIVLNRTENSTNQVIPNGTNLTLFVVNVSRNSSGNFSKDYSYNFDTENTNNSNVTITNTSSYANFTNLSSFESLFFLNRSSLANGSHIILRNSSNVVINGSVTALFTNGSSGNVSVNTSDREYRLIILSNSGINVSIVNMSMNQTAPNGTNLSNFTINNFSNETAVSADNFSRVTLNFSTYNYSNGTNSTYRVSTNIANHSNSTNFSLGNLAITFNYSNGSYLNFSRGVNVSWIGTNLSDSKNFSGSYEYIKRRNDTDLIETFSDVIEEWDLPKTVNGTFTIRVNVENVTNLTNFTNFSNSSNLIALLNTSVLNITYTDNFSRVTNQTLNYGNGTSIVFFNSTFGFTNDNNSTGNESVGNVSNVSYHRNIANGTNTTYSDFNLTIESNDTRKPNVSQIIITNTSHSQPSNNSSVNITNYSIYNGTTLLESLQFEVNVTNVTVNLSIGSNASNSTKYDSLFYLVNITDKFNNTSSVSIKEYRDQRSPFGSNDSNSSNLTFVNNTGFFNTNDFAANQDNRTVGEFCININTTFFKTNSCNFTLFRVFGNSAVGINTSNETEFFNFTNYTNGTNTSVTLDADIKNYTNESIANVSVINFTNSSYSLPTADITVNRTNFTIIRNTNYSIDNVSIEQLYNLTENFSIGNNVTNSTTIDHGLYLYNYTNRTSGLVNSTKIETRNIRSPFETNGNNLSFYNRTNITMNTTVNGSSANTTDINSCTVLNTTDFKTNSCNFTEYIAAGANLSVANISNITHNFNNTHFTNGTNTSYVLNFTNFSFVNASDDRVGHVRSVEIHNKSNPNNSNLTAATGDNFTFRSVNNTTDAFNATNPATANVTWCNFTNNTLITYFLNDSLVFVSQARNECRLLNTSIYVVSTLVFKRADNASLSNDTDIGYINVTKTINGTLVQNTTTDISVIRRRRMLMEEPAKSLKSVSTPQHFQNQDGNFIFISCFTGFGTSSLVRINQIVPDIPSMDTCLARIEREKPNYTVTKLREAYRDYISKNPNAA